MVFLKWNQGHHSSPFKSSHNISREIFSKKFNWNTLVHFTGVLAVSNFPAFHWHRPLHTPMPGTVGLSSSCLCSAVQPNGALKGRTGPHYFFIQMPFAVLRECFSHSTQFLFGSDHKAFWNCVCVCFFSVQTPQLFQGPEGVINVDFSVSAHHLLWGVSILRGCVMDNALPYSIFKTIAGFKRDLGQCLLQGTQCITLIRTCYVAAALPHLQVQRGPCEGNNTVLAPWQFSGTCLLAWALSRDRALIGAERVFCPWAAVFSDVYDIKGLLTASGPHV